MPAKLDALGFGLLPLLEDSKFTIDFVNNQLTGPALHASFTKTIISHNRALGGNELVLPTGGAASLSDKR